MNKIEAVTKLIDELESDSVYYDWDFISDCNMGLMARTVLGLDVIEMKAVVDNLIRGLPKRFMVNNTWKRILKRNCPVSGLSENETIKTLQETGFSRGEMIHLEKLSDPEILKRADIKDTSLVFIQVIFGSGIPFYEQKRNLIKYLKAWKEMLMEEEVLDEGYTAIA